MEMESSIININFEEGYSRGREMGFKEGLSEGLRLAEELMKAQLETNPKMTIEKDQLKNLIQ
jgi:hypothetical protein